MGIRKLFSDNYGSPMFSAVMSRNCFAFILQNLYFDDEITRAERWKKDRFTAIREFFEKFSNQCMLVLAPGDYLSLDQTLYPTRRQISFKQFNRVSRRSMAFFSNCKCRRISLYFYINTTQWKTYREGREYYIQGTETLH